MLRVVALASLAGLIVAHSPAQLPAVEVAGSSQESLRHLITDLPAVQDGGWWVRIGEKMYSPAFDGAFDSGSLSDYMLAASEGELPAALQKLRVGGDNSHGAHILRTDGQVLPQSKHVHVTPLKSETSLFVDAWDTNDSHEMDLEQHHVHRVGKHHAHMMEEDLDQTVTAVTEESYMAELTELTSIGSGGEKHQRNVFARNDVNEPAQYIGCKLRRAGFDVQLQPFKVSGNQAMNVVGCRGGTESNKFLFVGAHYDTLPGPPSRSEGALDNGSGVAVVTSTAKAISGYSFKNTVCMVGFDGEEEGCIGSDHLAKAIADTNLKSHFLGAITSDEATGFIPSAGNDGAPGWSKSNSAVVQGDHVKASQEGIHIDGSPESHKLVEAVAKGAKTAIKNSQTPILKSEEEIWRSDQRSFHRHGLSAVDICAAKHRLYKHYHSSQNVTANIDPKIGAQITRAAVATVFDLAVKEGHRPRDAEEQPATAKNIPKFEGAISFDTAFPSCDCNKLLDDYENSLPPSMQGVPQQHQEKHTKRTGDHAHKGQHEAHGKIHARETAVHATAGSHSKISLSKRYQSHSAQELEQELEQLAADVHDATED